MKGYIFALGKTGDVEKIVRSGLFGTRQRPEVIGGNQEIVFLNTTADYLTIAPGDKVFFFQNRRIYGIGEVIDYFGADRPAVLSNYPGSVALRPSANYRQEDALIEENQWRRIRIVVPFVPSPHFFTQGIDMDEVLSSPGAESAWGLRFWYGPSFQQLGVRETQLLQEVFHRRFYDTDPKIMVGQEPKVLSDMLKTKGATPASLVEQVQQKPSDFVRSDGTVKREAGLHALLIEHIRTKSSGWSQFARPPDFADVFHELAASPPKPSQYADRIDLFSTRETCFSQGLPVHFDIMEAKRDSIKTTKGRNGEDTIRSSLPQIMRYVDFVATNYAGGNYAAVSASFVARSFSDNMKDAFRQAKSGGAPSVASTISRSYVLSPRDRNPTNVWNDLNLLEYAWDDSRNLLTLSPVL